MRYSSSVLVAALAAAQQALPRPLAAAAAADACEAGGGCDSADDDFAALQLKRAKGTRVSKEADETPEWRDAVEVEKEFFERHSSWIQQQGERWHHRWTPPKKHWGPKNVFKPWWLSPVYVANVQANPQSGPYGPYENSPFEPHDPPSEPLRTPNEVRSENGVLSTVLTTDAAWLEVPGTGLRLRTRLFNGSYPGPTLRVRRGDLINITMINNLGNQRCPTRKWPRREGQATNEFPHGIPKDNPRYQDVGQDDTNPIDMKAKTNNLHDINTTNLHVHGWHVSPREPQDNVLDVKIDPGGKYNYSYELSPYHSSGNSWYHSHWHGSVTTHTTGGMIGALIVDDDPDGETADWIRDAKEETLVVHEADWSYFGPRWLQFFPDDEQLGCFPFESTFSVQCALGHRSSMMANLSGDLLYRMQYAKGFGFQVGENTPITAMFTVNGQYRPHVSLQAGEWVRMRWVFGSGNYPVNFVFADDAPCEMWLIAKDSAWIELYPRMLSRGIFMGAGNRAQVMARCTRKGHFHIKNNMSEYAFSSLDPQQIVLFVNVTESADGKDDVGDLAPPPTFQAVRPRYLQSLVDLPYSELYDPFVPEARNQYNDLPLSTPEPIKVDKTIFQVMDYDFPGLSPGLLPIPATAFRNQPVRFMINNMTFSHERAQATFPVGEVIELHATGIETHSWHMHTNPVQFVAFGEEDYKEVWGNFFEIGDWQDVLQLSDPVYDVRSANTTATVRFQTDCYSGQYVVHCHVLYHEDLGMMTWFNGTGEDHTVNRRFHNSGVFKDPPKQCMVAGQQCAKPWCTNYKYAPGPR